MNRPSAAQPQDQEQLAREAISHAEELHKCGNLSGAIREYQRAATLRSEGRSAATPRWVAADGRCAACGQSPCIRSVWCLFTFSEVRESILRQRLRRQGTPGEDAAPP